MSPLRVVERKLIVAVLLSAAGAALTGCTASSIDSPPSPPVTVAPSPTSAAAAIPEFTGPYAAELAERYAKSRADFEREALADGTITDAEQAEMVERLRTCLAGNGFELQKYTKTGAQEIKDLEESRHPDDGNEAVESCQWSSGANTVGLIYGQMVVNPQNIDLVPKIVACLKKHHLVAPGFSKSDYQRGIPRFPDDKRNAQVQQCNDDPLNLAKGE